MVKKKCIICGKDFEVIPCRKDTAKYCSNECKNKGFKAEPNVICSTCGKAFHMKQNQQNRYNRNLGYFCSKECVNKAKTLAYSGEGNHQFGLKGDLNASFSGYETIQKNHKSNEIMIYVPNHPYATKAGRVKKHRFIVEQNYHLFNPNYFEEINSQIVLKKNISVHHLDGNHNNNAIENLIPCTKKEHKQYHKSIILERDNKGKIVKTTAVLKQGELLETPEVDNQQPSTPLTKCEGSETNS